MSEPGDFYIENGFVIMTEQYHRRRGYCCGNGCRHCPYGHEAVPRDERFGRFPDASDPRMDS